MGTRLGVIGITALAGIGIVVRLGLIGGRFVLFSVASGNEVLHQAMDAGRWIYGAILWTLLLWIFFALRTHYLQKRTR